jgi:hypothetical protein
MVGRALGDVLSEYGFRRTELKVAAPERWISFHNSTTEMTVTQEIGGVPWLTLGPLERVEGKAPDSFDLAFYVQALGAPPMAQSAPAQVVMDQDLPALLGVLAEHLRKYGREPLAGRFDVLPKVRALAEERLRKRERELYGMASDDIGDSRPPVSGTSRLRADDKGP